MVLFGESWQGGEELGSGCLHPARISHPQAVIIACRSTSTRQTKIRRNSQPWSSLCTLHPRWPLLGVAHPRITLVPTLTILAIACPLMRSHSAAEPSLLPVASSRPSLLKAMDRMLPVWPCRRAHKGGLGERLCGMQRAKYFDRPGSVLAGSNGKNAADVALQGFLHKGEQLCGMQLSWLSRPS